MNVRSVGIVRSSITSRDGAPKQGREGAPDAWIEIEADVLDALDGLRTGDEIIVITWFDRADRNVLLVHPRGEESKPVTGVFATRSPDRPNPLGLHRVTIREISSNRILVGPIEALDGTPVVDIKPVLSSNEA